MSFLDVKNISLGFGKTQVVSDFSLSLNAGEIVVILGVSGAGKSTLLKGISGLHNLESGSVFFQDEPLKPMQEQLIPGHEEIKLVNQDFALDEYHTVEENIRLKLLSYEKDYQLERIEMLLDLVDLGSNREQAANQLSGGQKQRLAIARALANEPELLLLDEPFNQLDFVNKSRISEHILGHVKDRGIATIMVTHNGIEAMQWADRIVHLEDGRAVRTDTADRFYSAPKNVDEALLFGKLNCIQLDGGRVYFRPAAFALSQKSDFQFRLALQFEFEKKIGWYYESAFRFEGQQIQLFSTESMKEVKEIFVSSLNFDD